MMRCLVNPLCLFLLIWGGSTTLYAGGVCSGIFPSPAGLTVALVLLNVVTFTLGYLTWTLFRGLGAARETPVVSAQRPLTADAAARLLKFTLAAGVIALLLDMYRLGAIARYYNTTWLDLVTHPGLLRIRMVAFIGDNVFQTSSTVMLLSVTNALFWIGFVLLGVFLHLDRTWRRYLYLAAFLAVSLTFSLFHVSRCEAAASVLYLVFAYCFTASTDRSRGETRAPASCDSSRRTSRLTLLIPALAIVLLFAVVDVLLQKSSHYDQPSYLEGFLFQAFWYLASPLAAFNEFITHFTGDHQWGQNMFLPLYKWLCRFHLAREVEVSYYGEKVFIPYMTNVYTYLRNFYQDFGILGVAIVPYILGWATAAIRARARRHFQFLNLYLVLLLFIFFSFYNYYLGANQIYLQVFFGFVLFRYELPESGGFGGPPVGGPLRAQVRTS